MQQVPHWQWLMVLYFALVAIPVFFVHAKLKPRLLQDKSFRNLAIYFGAIVGTAFLMHFATMWLYFKFVFLHKS
ncbi:MAG: hypothetical protein K0Q66_1188 [Chitinophagaceae bacterium]|jgi:hypothetical protein|nr:hypothetical protein [Chitinophagaceae bacterium]